MWPGAPAVNSWPLEATMKKYGRTFTKSHRTLILVKKCLDLYFCRVSEIVSLVTVILLQVRILNHITWKKIAQFEHPATVTSTKVASIFCHLCLTKKPLSLMITEATCCVGRLCIKKWRKGQLLPVKNTRYTT